jgi:hypothetical protein
MVLRGEDAAIEEKLAWAGTVLIFAPAPPAKTPPSIERGRRNAAVRRAPRASGQRPLVVAKRKDQRRHFSRALTPRSGREPCAARPWTVTSSQMQPLWPQQTWFISPPSITTA